MLTETIDNAMERAQKYETYTRTTRFSNIFKNISISKESQEKLLKHKLSQYIKAELPQEKAEENADDYVDFIVEDPDAVPVKITLCEDPTNLPFFKSIQYKLNHIYC